MKKEEPKKNSPLSSEDLPKTAEGGNASAIPTGNHLNEYVKLIEQAVTSGLEKSGDADYSVKGVVVKNVKDAKDGKDIPDMNNKIVSDKDEKDEQKKIEKDNKTHKDKDEADEKRRKDNKDKIDKDIRDRSGVVIAGTQPNADSKFSDDLIDAMIDALKKMKSK